MEVLEACKQAMDMIGERFKKGEAFTPELILAGEMMTAICAVIKPHMAGEAGDEKLGKVVFGTVEGDIHDIAKDIVAFMLDINGFEVTDLGVDVPPAKFVEAAKETGAKIVALSGFLTLAFDPMDEGHGSSPEGCRFDRCQGHDRWWTDRRTSPQVQRSRCLWP